MNREIKHFVIFLGIFLSIAVNARAAAIVIGPGPHLPLTINSPADYHVLSGTDIIVPPNVDQITSGITVRGGHAISFQGGGQIQFDGGNFRGGDARNTLSGAVISTRGGTALRLFDSSATIYGGAFRGGNAFSAGYVGLHNGGQAISAFESHLIVWRYV